MINLKKIVVIALLSSVFIAAIPALYIMSAETYIWMFEGDAEAEAHAHRVFLRVCDEQGFNEADFHGPVRDNIETDKKIGIRSYVWIGVNESIFITMSYFPSDIQYSIERNYNSN